MLNSLSWILWMVNYLLSFIVYHPISMVIPLVMNDSTDGGRFLCRAPQEQWILGDVSDIITQLEDTFGLGSE